MTIIRYADNDMERFKERLARMENQMVFLLVNQKSTPIPIFSNNVTAIAAGRPVGSLYRNNGDPDIVCIVH